MSKIDLYFQDLGRKLNKNSTKNGKPALQTPVSKSGRAGVNQFQAANTDLKQSLVPKGLNSKSDNPAGKYAVNQNQVRNKRFKMMYKKMFVIKIYKV